MFPLTPDQHHWLEVATEDEGWCSFTSCTPSRSRARTTVETGRNTLQNVNKIYHFTLTVSPHYIVKLKPRINSTFWSQSPQCVRSNRLFATFAESCPMFVFSIFLVGSSFISLLAEKISHWGGRGICVIGFRGDGRYCQDAHRDLTSCASSFYSVLFSFLLYWLF